MGDTIHRKRQERKTNRPMGIGIAYLQQDGYNTDRIEDTKKPVHYIDLMDKTDERIYLRTARDISLETPFILQLYDRKEEKWQSCQCTGKRITPENPDKNNTDKNKTDSAFFLMECEYWMLDDNTVWCSADKANEVPSPEDYAFLKETRFFKSIDRGRLCPLLNALTFKRVPAGELFMKQGDKGDSCFIIQKGTCTVTIRRKEKTHQIATIKQGGIVGEMAILTGEVRSASVRARTDMELWRIGRDQFDEISARYPDMRNFLTEVITERFSSRKRTAKREIGKYVITDIIGKGGYAIVYGGHHHDLNMPVAVKMMKHDMAMDEEFLKNFRNEARLIAQFNHRNIVRVYDIEERFRTIFVIMEFLEGIPLDEKLSDVTKLSYPKVVDYLIQISAGLDYAHNRGVVHQDIKPANIFIRKNKRVKILDFGLACPISTENSDFLGSPFYMSPEQIEMEAVDQRSDIYSLGIMAYEMALGKRPYPEDDLLKLEDLHVEENIPDPKEIDPELPDELRAFIVKACSRDKEKRYRNMTEVLDHLQPLKDQYSLDQNGLPREKRKMTSLFLFSNEEDQLELNHLLEEFTLKAKALGIDLKATEFSDI